MPDHFFVQAGHAIDNNSGTVGVTSEFWRHPLASSTLTAYWEAAIGRWRIKSQDEIDNEWITQIGLTPVIRWWPSNTGLFFEAGIGANAIFPVLHDTEHQFSTVFQFGDHLGAGYRFGEAQQHEVALRIEHFSNGGVKEPNPGDNFVQLRYSHSF